MDTAIDAILEIFTWVGLGAGLLLTIVTVIIKLADGTWLPTRAIVEHREERSLVRWFDADGGVNAAHLNHEQAHALAGKEMADIFYRRGTPNRMRLTLRSPSVRAVGLLAAGMLGLGVVAMILAAILLFARG